VDRSVNDEPYCIGRRWAPSPAADRAQDRGTRLALEWRAFCSTPCSYADLEGVQEVVISNKSWRNRAAAVCYADRSGILATRALADTQRATATSGVKLHRVAGLTLRCAQSGLADDLSGVIA